MNTYPLGQFGRRKLLETVLFTTCLITVNAAYSQQKSPTPVARTEVSKQALQRADIANELLAQTQRAIRLYMQELLEVDHERAKANISQSISKISALIDKFNQSGPDAEELKTVAQIDSIWSQLIRPLSGEANKSQLGSVFALNAQLLENCERLEQEIAKDYNHGKGDLLNLVGHQAMLSQRIAANHFLLQLDITRSSLRTQVLRDLSRFTTIANEIVTLADTNNSTRQLYELIQVQVILFKPAIEKQATNTKNEMQSIARSSERLHELHIQFMKELEKN